MMSPVVHTARTVSRFLRRLVSTTHMVSWPLRICDMASSSPVQSGHEQVQLAEGTAVAAAQARLALDEDTDALELLVAEPALVQPAAERQCLGGQPRPQDPRRLWGPCCPIHSSPCPQGRVEAQDPPGPRQGLAAQPGHEGTQPQLRPPMSSLHKLFQQGPGLCPLACHGTLAPDTHTPPGPSPLLPADVHAHRGRRCQDVRDEGQKPLQDQLEGGTACLDVASGVDGVRQINRWVGVG